CPAFQLNDPPPQADLRMFRAMDSDGIGTESAVAEQIAAAVAGGARILSLSFGTQTIDNQGPVILRAALAAAFAAAPDLLVVAAAGNYGDARPCYPAAFTQEFPNVVAVAGLTAAGAPAPWSSRGAWVTCSTIGEGVVSTYVKGTEDLSVQDPPDVFCDDAWAAWTGTSFAAPQIAGAVARICAQQPALTPKQAFDQLIAGGTPIPGYGRALTVLPGT
ncbi:MAG: S8 family serine peptidase, partial [Pseudonocardia sp.]|nr:S8 family serine peptidase [Pseudonocardia sp.]